MTNNAKPRTPKMILANVTISMNDAVKIRIIKDTEVRNPITISMVSSLFACSSFSFFN